MYFIYVRVIDLDGDTVGVAFVETMCFVHGSVGLTQDGGVSLSEAVALAAHELGHIFNMDHDKGNKYTSLEINAVLAVANSK